ncbi:hypothetical protein M3484_08415 [Pseudomonas sp. GX19020]|uniref:hypothetical protein n=1 Tax=Pseudomonas sp. GX19020 TaxID=2942277 RepID=UPI002019CCAE|nr:hypothetical protein [Pseudomonas sp. GX19020]MCL4066594.1 hypothetical protein [Pseudomonas sp. GX19020]
MAVLRLTESGVAATELCREHGITMASFDLNEMLTRAAVSCEAHFHFERLKAPVRSIMPVLESATQSTDLLAADPKITAHVDPVNKLCIGPIWL